MDIRNNGAHITSICFILCQRLTNKQLQQKQNLFRENDNQNCNGRRARTEKQKYGAYYRLTDNKLD